jgi:1-acyl-sn-glycerol-3-phosphate acyltransferase
MSVETESYLADLNPELYEQSVRRTRKVIRRLFGLNVYGHENVPAEGAGILAFVHRSYIDPWAIGAATERQMRGMGKKQLQNWYYFGVDEYFAKRGIFLVDRDSPGKDVFETSMDVIRNYDLLAVAPEGTHKNRGRAIGPTKFGVGRFAALADSENINCPVVPVAMSTEGIPFRRPINVLYGSPLNIVGPVETIKQRRSAARLLDEKLRVSLQECNDRVYDMSEDIAYDIKP